MTDEFGTGLHDFDTIAGSNAIPVPKRQAGAQGSTFTPTVVQGIDVGFSTGESALDRFYDDIVLVRGADIGCTAIAIGTRVLLTARHCMAVTTAYVRHLDGRSETIPIQRSAGHPRRELDIAVLVTSSDLGLPVRPRAGGLAVASSSGLVKIVGFGTTDRTGRKGFGAKRQALLASADWRCTAQRALRTGCIPNAEIVVSGAESDTCTGDSGGPVFDLVRGAWQLAGVTSRAIPGASSSCGGGGIYTSVGAVVEWLDQQVSAR